MRLHEDDRGLGRFDHAVDAGESICQRPVQQQHCINTRIHVEQYFLIENRHQTARCALPDQGLAVIGLEGSNNNQQQTPELHCMTFVQADGHWDLEHNGNYGDSTDLWERAAIRRLYADHEPQYRLVGRSHPISRSWASALGTTMTFDFLDTPDCNYNHIPDG